MEIKPLTIKQQIQVLKCAKKEYQKEKSLRNGMCFYLENALSHLHLFNGEEEINYNYLSILIPSFSRYSLIEAGEKGLIPEVEFYLYYWDRNDLTIRPKVFDYLINNLKKQK